MKFEFFSEDPDTHLFFEIVGWCMKRYFEYDEAAAEAAIKAFYTGEHNRFNVDDFHRDLPFRVATRVHYFTALGVDEDEYRRWLLDNDFQNTPSEAHQYYLDTYFTTPS